MEDSKDKEWPSRHEPLPLEEGPAEPPPASPTAQLDMGAFEARIRGITEGLNLAVQILRQQIGD